MVIKKYIVNSMNEAMTRIRYELGNDAVIVSQRKVKRKGFIGFFSKKVIEVTAAVDNTNKNTDIDVEESLEVLRKVMDFDKRKLKGENARSDSREKVIFNQGNKEESIHKLKERESKAKVMEEKDEESNLNLVREMCEMKKMLKDLAESNFYEGNKKSNLYYTLNNYDLNDEVIEEIENRIKLEKKDIDDTEKLRNVMGSMFETTENINDGVIVLVGPTGVGKTTTIAKLAGRLSLIEKKKVGLITVDTYRIGAVEQLKTYADIMNIPFKVVFSIKEMETTIESMKDCDVVLVDTTGRSSKNTMQISELRAYINKTNSDNIHLVLSATTKNSDVKSIVEGYYILNYNKVIITKLDETTTYGSIINILCNAGKPLSYVTTGQNVPDDIKEIDSEEVLNLVLGVETVC